MCFLGHKRKDKRQWKQFCSFSSIPWQLLEPPWGPVAWPRCWWCWWWRWSRPASPIIPTPAPPLCLTKGNTLILSSFKKSKSLFRKKFPNIFFWLIMAWISTAEQRVLLSRRLKCLKSRLFSLNTSKTFHNQSFILKCLFQGKSPPFKRIDQTLAERWKVMFSKIQTSSNKRSWQQDGWVMAAQKMKSESWAFIGIWRKKTGIFEASPSISSNNSDVCFGQFLNG